MMDEFDDKEMMEILYMMTDILHREFNVYLNKWIEVQGLCVTYNLINELEKQYIINNIKLVYEKTN